MSTLTRRKHINPSPAVRVFSLGIVICCFSVASATAAIPAQIASSVGKSIVKYFGKEGAQEATEYLTKKGGQELAERVTTAAVKQGGDDAVKQVSVLVGKHGPEALAALDNAPALLPVLGALDEIPKSQVRLALSKLAAGQSGKELAEGVSRYGAAALRTELKHPGVGLVLVRSLGDEGVDLASRLSTNQAIAIGRHADDIARLPAAQRSGLLALLRRDTERVVTFVGRFVEANPGKTLFTVATTTVILAEPERILGGDEVVFDADGNPVVVRKRGIVDRSIETAGSAAAHVSERYIRPLFLAAAAFAATFATLLIGLKLWHVHRREKLKTKAMIEGTSSTDTPN